MPLLQSEFDQNSKKLQEIEKKASEDLRKLHSQQSPGIARSLMDFGTVANNVWGDDDDIKLALKNLITLPEDVQTSGIYILPPVSIAGADTGGNEQHVFLQNAVRTVLNNNPDKEILLFTPVVSAQSHWRIAGVKLEQGKIQLALLWDSVANPDLKETPAFKNIKTAIKELDKDAQIEATSEGIQNDGSLCAAYVTQALLKQITPKEQIVTKSQAAIRDAQTAETLHASFVAAIAENMPSSTVKNQKLDVPVKEIFNQRVPRRKLEKILHKSFTDFAGKDPETINETVELQIKFDAEMAKQLNKLYKTKPNASDKELANRARFHAFTKLQKTMGFFPPTTTTVEQPQAAKSVLKPKRKS